MIHEVNYAPYWSASVKPRNFLDFAQMVETQGRITGIWEIAQQDKRTGEILKRVWNKNVITDLGAQNILQRAINTSGATLPVLFNILAATNNSGSTTLTTALANSTAYTTLAVNALPAAIPSGTNLIVGFGGANPQGGYSAAGVITSPVVTSASAAQGATSISVTSFTTTAAFPIGTNIVPLPLYTDNPPTLNGGVAQTMVGNATTALQLFSGILASGITFTPTTGQGNRQVVVTYTFTGSSTNAGSYTDMWLTNFNSGTGTAAGYIAHEINTPMAYNTSNNIVATMTIKI